MARRRSAVKSLERALSTVADSVPGSAGKRLGELLDSLESLTGCLATLRQSESSGGLADAAGDTLELPEGEVDHGLDADDERESDTPEAKRRRIGFKTRR